MNITLVTPWRRIWLHPRRTVHEVLQRPSLGGLWLLPIASGMVQSLVQAASNNVGARVGWLWILGGAFLMGGLWGLLQLHILAGCLYVGSKLFGAGSSFSRLRQVVAVSNAPLATAVVFWLGAALTMGSQAFIAPDVLAAQYPASALEASLLYLATSACVVWSMVVLALGLAESEEMSVLGGFGLFLGTVLLLAIAIGVLAAILIPIFMRR